MLKDKKGFSLIVLVIAIAVIIIITSTAVVTVKNISKDRMISEFMADLNDAKQYLIEYVNKNETLPIKRNLNELGEEIDAEKELLSALELGNALGQVDEDDTGKYYFLDITKLGKIHLVDTDRGYIFNEGTLNVYVTTPVEYKEIKYYTITSDLSGRKRSTSSVPFEVSITGNPVTWSSRAEILVSVTNLKVKDADGWNFRWLKGSHSVDDFKVASEVNYFDYGETIDITENGIYTINVEDAEGRSIVRKIVVTKIDDIPPTAVRKDGKIYVDDTETGIKVIRYKIRETNNFIISDEARKEHPEVYASKAESSGDTPDELEKKYLWGDENIKGDRIENYLADYKIYYDQLMQYNEIVLNPDSTQAEYENASKAIRVLNTSYPQFAYDNRPFPNNERNILIYIEDMAGNGTVFSAASRVELTNLQYILENKETLMDSKVLINNGNKYTNSREVTLHMQSMHAKKFYVANYPNPDGTGELFRNTKEKYILTEGEGLKKVFVKFENEAGKSVQVSGEILLDTTKPSRDVPFVIKDGLNVTVQCKQTDTKIVGGEETQSGIDQDKGVTYGIRNVSESGPGNKDEDSYEWFNKTSDFPKLWPGNKYVIVTKATDRAGNSEISDEFTVKDTIAENVEIGDYVQYDGDSTNSYTLYTSNTGYSGQDGVVVKPESSEWRVWKLIRGGEHSGDVIIISEKPVSKFYLRGRTGFNNSTDIIESICGLYTNSALGVTADDITSIKAEDIEDKYNATSMAWNNCGNRKMSSCTYGSILRPEKFWLKDTDTSASSFKVKIASSEIVTNGVALVDSSGNDLEYAYGVRPLIRLNADLRMVGGTGLSGAGWKFSK